MSGTDAARTARVTVVTDRHQVGRRAGLEAVVTAALAGGAARVLLRDKDLPAGERAPLANRLREVTAATGAALVVAGDVDLALAVGADGVHLAAADPWPPPGLGIAVGRSCHDLDELVEAHGRDADWATYSPVYATPSKPGYGPPLGLTGLADGCRTVPRLAVLALGGVGPGRVRACLDAGAAGVAVMGAVMAADDPAAVVRAMIDETET